MSSEAANAHGRKANAAAGAVTPEQKAQIEAAQAAPEKRKVPMELHPRTFAHRVGVTDDDKEDAAVQTAHRTFNNLSKALDDLYQREVTIRADKSKTPQDHALRVSKLANNALTTPAAKMDGARKTVTQSIAAIDTTIERTFKEALPTEDAREIRAHVKSLPTEERRAFLKDADDQVIAAVLAGKPFLSGMGPAEAATLRHSTVERRFPGEVARRAKLVKARDMLDHGWQLYMGATAALRDTKADDYEKAATAADEAVTQPLAAGEEAAE